MSRTQFLSILRECSGAPRSKMRISFLYYIGSFPVWRGVEYGLVHAVSPCTGGVRRQFENCGYRRQYSKSEYAPLCRRSAIGFRYISHCRSVDPTQYEERSSWGLVGPTNVDPIVQSARVHSMIDVAKSIATFGIRGPRDGLSIQ